MERDVFEDLKKHEFYNAKLRKNVKLCKFASWAIWKEDGRTNTDFIDNDEAVQQLKNNVVFVALNPGGDDINKLLNEKADWKNFHAGTKKNPGKLSAGDRKLRNVLGGSKYKGAYMTDIIKDVAHGNAKIFIKTLTPEDIKTNIGYFIEEIELLRSNEIEMFLFGSEVEKIFRGYCECLAKIKEKVKICQRIEHFSPSNPRFESIARIQLGLASGDILKKTLWGK